MYVGFEFGKVTKKLFSPKDYISSLHVVSSLLDSGHSAYRYQSTVTFQTWIHQMWGTLSDILHSLSKPLSNSTYFIMLSLFWFIKSVVRLYLNDVLKFKIQFCCQKVNNFVSTIINTFKCVRYRDICRISACSGCHNCWHCCLNKLLRKSRTYCTRSPFLNLLSRHAQSGRWSSLGKRVWFTESAICLYLFFYLLNLFLIWQNLMYPVNTESFFY